MAVQGQIGNISYNDERARADAHTPVILSGKLKSDQGELPVGLILTKDENKEFIPYAEITGEVLGTGDGATKAFSGTLVNKPVEPGTVVATDGTETFTDDGYGNLKGDAGGTGTLNYKDVAISLSFNANVADETDVTVEYATAIDGILDETVDTSVSDSATYIIHGSVRHDALKVGASAKAAPSEVLLNRLLLKGIYPE